MCEFHSSQVTPAAATQQLSAAAEESWRSFRAGKSSGGCSSGLEQGAADATPEPPALGKKREGTGARSMMIEGWRATQDWREIWVYSIRRGANLSPPGWVPGFPAHSHLHHSIPHSALSICLSAFSHWRAVTSPTSPCPAVLSVLHSYWAHLLSVPQTH